MYGLVCFLWYAVADGPVGPAVRGRRGRKRAGILLMTCFVHWADSAVVHVCCCFLFDVWFIWPDVVVV
jgi:hypothetical protein